MTPPDAARLAEAIHILAARHGDATTQRLILGILDTATIPPQPKGETKTLDQKIAEYDKYQSCGCVPGLRHCEEHQPYLGDTRPYPPPSWRKAPTPTRDDCRICAKCGSGVPVRDGDEWNDGDWCHDCWQRFGRAALDLLTTFANTNPPNMIHRHPTDSGETRP